MRPSSRWPRRLRRTGLWTLAVVVILALVVGLAGVWAVRRPFPAHAGVATMAGLSAPVTVHRDGYGIPQIYAETVEDLFRAQGFVHAQDRFWEMDFRRHVTSGRLAEWFGEDQVEADTFLRTVGWRRVAEAEWELISPASRRFLTAYADGVDAWIDHTGGPAATGGKALHYRLLGTQSAGYEVYPWDPVDTLAWLKAMAWDLRTNLDAEIDRARLLAAGLTREQVDQLYPEYPFQDHPPIVSGAQVEDGASGAGGGLAPDGSPSVAGAGVGSNSWVVSGEHTGSGAPILVNDPHLGVSMPNIWYQVGLHCTCGYQVSGFSFAGVPGVVIGHNDRIAWGLTNLGADVTDLYLERLDGDRYEVDGQWRELLTHQETIAVAGGDEVTVEVRNTHRGPLISDAVDALRQLAGSEALAAETGAAVADGAGGYALSLAWAALTPGRTIDALFAINQASDWEDFQAAAALFEVPAQNLTYADVEGNIGYQAPGRVPVRPAGDGRWPAPGWDSSYDWNGFVPFEELPHLLNPPEGMIVTANQAVIGPLHQPLLTHDWGYGYRSDRILALLRTAAAAGPLGISDMEQVLVDDADGFAPTLVPALLAVPAESLGGGEAAARDLLRDWDFRQPAGGEPGTPDAHRAAAAAYYQAVWRHLLALTFDELPDDQQPFGGGRWFQVVAGLLDEPDSPWWNRTGTAAVETRDDVLATALAGAYHELVDAQGDDPRQWRWGRMHTLMLRDSTFGSSGIGPVEALFNRGPVEAAGGADAVNATWWDAAAGYEVTVAPSMRMIIDMSDLDNARWVQVTGNSGHPYHPNYADQLDLWRTSGTLPWRWHRNTIEAEAIDTLMLAP